MEFRTEQSKEIAVKASKPEIQNYIFDFSQKRYVSSVFNAVKGDFKRTEEAAMASYQEKLIKYLKSN